MKKILFLLLILLSPNITFAKTVFLDNHAGVTNGCTNYDPASRSCGGGTYTAYSNAWDASQALQNGDILKIRQGEYYSDVSGNPGYNWGMASMTLDRATNVTVENYNGEEVWIKGGTSRTSVVNHTNNALSIAADNVTVRGLHIYGCVIFGSGNNEILENSDLSGGWDHQSSIGGDAWYDVIRFYHSTNAIVRNCKIHDNFNHGTATAAANKSLIMHERDVNTIVENCEFYNPVAGFVYAKYQPTTGTVHATYRYNWFRGAGIIEGPNSNHGKQIKIYQNVFTNTTKGLFYRDGATTRTFYVYNNTFYNCASGLYSWSSSTCDVHLWFNNIFCVTNGTRHGVDYNEVPGSISGGYYDYNDYYAAGGLINWRHNYSTYSSLSSWSSHLGNGDGTEDSSITSNPGFKPDDGVLDGNDPTDFKRITYTTNGRGGSWPSVMGAYITGNEVIGLLNGQSQPPPTQPPGIPQNTRVIP